MKIVMMLLILTAIMRLISTYVDWLKGLDELMAFDEYVDCLKDMLDNNIAWEAIE